MSTTMCMSTFYIWDEFVVRGLLKIWVLKYVNKLISNISETVQDRDIVTMED